jgi:hypothetical protein
MVVAGYYDDVEGAYRCRTCMAKLYGEATVARLTEGLSCGLPDHSPAVMYEIYEASTDAGYENASQCDLPLYWRPGKLGPRCYAKRTGPGERFCERCAYINCFDCGTRLDRWAGAR